MFRGRSPEQRNSRNFSQSRYSRSNSQINPYRNNYSRSTEANIHLIPIDVQILGKDITETIDHEIHHTIEIEIIQIIEIEVIRTTEINVTKTIDQETIHTTDLIINEPIKVTIIDHQTIHKIGIPNITINNEIIHNLLIETIIATPNPNTNIEVTQRTSTTN